MVKKETFLNFWQSASEESHQNAQYQGFPSDGTRRNGVPAPFLTQNFWL
jgi:hypothetical protein